MRMRQVENSLSLLESGMEIQAAESSSRKRVIVIAAIFIVIFTSAILFCYFFHLKTPEICWAQATLESEIQASDLSVLQEPNKWKWLPSSSFCMKETKDKKMKIFKEGIYLIYAQLTERTQSKAPFAAQLRKGDIVLSESQSKEGVIRLLGIHHLKKQDEISLILNDDETGYIEENSTQTYWGILRMAPYTS